MNHYHQERLKKLEEFLIPETAVIVLFSHDVDEKARANIRLSEYHLERREIYHQIGRHAVDKKLDCIRGYNDSICEGVRV